MAYKTKNVERHPRGLAVTTAIKEFGRFQRSLSVKVFVGANLKTDCCPHCIPREDLDGARRGPDGRWP
jgi:hypothetical protein